MKLKIPQFKKLPTSYLTIAAVFLILILPFIAFADTNPYSAALKGITTLLFIAFFTLFAAITFLAIAVMLFIRYIALTILLILSPLVWLFWIFPSTKEYWSKWWHNFLKWAMFLPAVLFFLYLTVATIGKFPDMLVKYAGPQRNLPNQGFAIDVAYIADLVAILGLLIGGLYTANALGIYGAKTFYGWSQSIGKGFGAWAGRKGVQAGTAPVRWAPVRKRLEKLENLGVGKNRFLRNLTAPVRQGAARLSRLGGIASEKVVEDAKKRLPADNWRLAKMINTLDAPARIAALQRLRDNKSLDLLDNASDFINPETEALWGRYGQPKPDYTNMERAVGFNSDMLKIARGEKVVRKVVRPDGTEGEKELTLADAAQEFYKNFRPEHFNKMQVDEFFKRPSGKEFGLDQGTHAQIQAVAIQGILETNPDGIANIFRNIKGINRENFIDLFYKHIDSQKGAMGRRQWLESQGDKYRGLTTFLDSPGCATLGFSLGPKEERGKETGPTLPGYQQY